MSVDDHKARLARLSEAHAAREEARQPRMQPPGAGEGAPRSRRHKVQRALWHLEQGGITGAHAYAPLFRALARIGFAPKPLFYWGWVPLFLFGFMLFTSLMGLAVVLSLLLGVMPRPIMTMIEAGPTVFFSLMAVMALAFTAYHKVKATALELPRWRDI